MSKRVLFLGRVLIVALLAAAITTGATGLGTLGGQVLGPDGKVISSARVTLQASDGKDPQTAETNAQGRFWFPMLPTGPYDVRAYSQGRVSEWRKNVWVDVGRQTTITLHLRTRKRAPVKSPSAVAEP
jgi:Carboxypeptidase regulatory-like domain